MEYIATIKAKRSVPVSPLVLCDRFLRLAEDADRAGFRSAAERLIQLADQVLTGPPLPNTESGPAVALGQRIRQAVQDLGIPHAGRFVGNT